MDKDVITGHAPQEQGIANSSRAKVKDKSSAIPSSVSSNRATDNKPPSHARRKSPPSNNTFPKPRATKPCRNPHCFRLNQLRDAAAKTGQENWLAESKDEKRLFFPLSFA
jgi:hypothetical protein